jgi:hypothetical protein
MDYKLDQKADLSQEDKRPVLDIINHCSKANTGLNDAPYGSLPIVLGYHYLFVVWLA